MKKILIGIMVLALAYTVFAGAPSSDWDKSTLVYNNISGGNCDEVYAEFCNHGQAMNGTTTYEVYYTAGGDPKSGSVVSSGIVSALGADQCETLTYDPNGVLGTYMFKVYQRPLHPGIGELWSAAINIESCNGNEIPEFTTIGAGIALLGAAAYLYKKRQ